MRPRWSTSTDRLVHYIAHNCQPSLQSELGAWLQSRPRFAEFVSRHQDKIRKWQKKAEEAEAQGVLP